MDEDGVCVAVSRQAVDEVLAWIDRYVPRALGCSVGPATVGAIQTLVIDHTGLEDIDLVRVDGRAFVPEVAAIVTPLDELSADDRGVLVSELESFANQARYSEPEVGVFGSDQLGDALEQLARLVADSGDVAGRCRICGCTRVTACDVEVDETTSRACGWADESRTLCDNPACLAAAGADDLPELLLDQVAPLDDESRRRLEDATRNIGQGL